MAATEMMYRTLGRTGARVSAIGLDGWHVGLKTVSEELSIRIIRSALDRGMNFLDNCWDYNDAPARFEWARRYAMVIGKKRS